MPGPDDEQQLADSLERVRTWVGKQGFALEKATADAFELGGFAAYRGRTYTDPITRKTREADVVAFGRRWPPYTVDHMVVVECKTAGGDPWLFRRAELDDNQRLWHPIASPELARFFSDGTARSRLGACFPVETGASFDVLEARRDARAGRKDREQDLARNTVLQVLSAAHGLLEKTDRPTLVVPIIVTKGELFTLNYGPGLTEVVERVHRQRLLFTRDGEPTPTIVDVVSESGLQEHVDWLDRTLASLYRAYPHDLGQPPALDDG